MACLNNFLLRTIQYYSIFYGFTYVYIDIERNTVKFPKFLKYYANFVNLIYTILAIYLIIDKINSIMFNDNEITLYMYTILNFMQIFVLAGLTLRRLLEEKALRKWLKAFSPLLAIAQFQKLPQLSTDKTTKFIQISSVIIVFIMSFYNVCLIVLHIIHKEWFSLMETCMLNYFFVMEYYILMHHSFILCYIANCYTKLNNQLRNEDILEPFARIFFELSLLLIEVNRLNGPIILVVLANQIIQIALNAYNMFEFIFFIESLYDIFYIEIIVPISIILVTINIFLYFKICDHVCRTTKRLGNCIMEYYVNKENREVCKNFNRKNYF